MFVMILDFLLRALMVFLIVCIVAGCAAFIIAADLMRIEDEKKQERGGAAHAGH